MRNSLIPDFYGSPSTPLAVVLGTNEIASAVTVHLTSAGYPVILSHDPFPPVIRRAMAFHDALFGERPVVEDVAGERAETAWEIASVLAKPHHVAVTPLHLTDLIALRPPEILIDARMQKHRVTPDYRRVVNLTIGLGPNFAVDVNCDIAIETRPAKNGSIVRRGRTDEADGVARSLGGVGKERFVYSSHEGHWHTPFEIGMGTTKGAVLGHLDGHPVVAPIDGVLRGLARDSSLVPAGVKLLEIDARGAAATWTGIDDRGRAIAEATLQAIDLHAPHIDGGHRAAGACVM
ncbi:xanthine dehydrogenase [Azospirillum sp. TSO22-1]|uniref:xanthine dehydrogenase n=1 Tax=Azospirillum sp. TSO22-1 TaxID=716789 RepID=UPI000D60F8EB|nr:xanthine dehydrogenase [Azospirillum sp. TSO22-1]PWC42376.1 xanthine dehydrogenase [Azospirillum sp. TSO22-1]